MNNLMLMFLLSGLPPEPRRRPDRRVPDLRLEAARNALASGSGTAADLSDYAVGTAERALESGPLFAPSGAALLDFDAAMVALEREGVLLRDAPVVLEIRGPCSEATSEAIFAFDRAEGEAARAALLAAAAALGGEVPEDAVGASWAMEPGPGGYLLSITRGSVVVGVG